MIEYAVAAEGVETGHQEHTLFKVVGANGACQFSSEIIFDFG